MVRGWLRDWPQPELVSAKISFSQNWFCCTTVFLRSQDAIRHIPRLLDQDQPPPLFIRSCHPLKISVRNAVLLHEILGSYVAAHIGVHFGGRVVVHCVVLIGIHYHYFSNLCFLHILLSSRLTVCYKKRWRHPQTVRVKSVALGAVATKTSRALCAAQK